MIICQRYFELKAKATHIENEIRAEVCKQLPIDSVQRYEHGGNWVKCVIVNTVTHGGDILVRSMRPLSDDDARRRGAWCTVTIDGRTYTTYRVDRHRFFR